MCIDKSILAIEKLIPFFEKKNLKVSAVNVGWHLDHSLKVINSASDALKQSDPKNYKSYDDLKARLNTVLKLNSVGKQTTTQVTQRPAEKQNDIPPWVQEGDAVIDGDDVPSSNNGVDETIDDIQSFLNSFENDNN